MEARVLVPSLLAAAVVAVGLVLFGGAGGGSDGGGTDGDARETLERFVDAWARGDDAAAAGETDEPTQAVRALRASRSGMDDVPMMVMIASLDGDSARSRARLDVAWKVADGKPFTYTSTATAVPALDGDGWRVRWSDKIIHPQLEETSRLGTAGGDANRGDVLDRDGRRIVTERAVVQVDVRRPADADVSDRASKLAGILDLESLDLEDRLDAARPGQAVPVVTLRRAEYLEVRGRLDPFPGVQTRESRAPLAPAKSFARALLGTVGPATAEQVDRSGGRVRPGDVIGQGGLQGAFEERLGATAEQRIVVRDRSDGTELEVLRRAGGTAGRSLRTTLDLDVQRAAERALSDDGDAALVAVEPSTGDVLAVANRPRLEPLNRALEGRYPPGSTFKVVSTAALLRAGLDLDETVDCPGSTLAGEREFRNADDEALGMIDFRTAFARSCNTAFVAQASELEPDALSRVARDFGLGVKPDLGVAAATAEVPPGTDAAAEASAMIGQDRIAVSPLAMAGVAATVADGRWRPPRLLRDRAAGEPEPLLEEQEATELRALMRQVVTNGTGAALARIPGEVLGKSGTAEYEDGDPPPTHAWFIAAREEIAVAVILEDRASGSGDAAPVLQRFFTELDAIRGAGEDPVAPSLGAPPVQVAPEE